MNEEKIVKWFYDHEELLLEIMDKKPYQSDGWDYEIEVVKDFLATNQSCYCGEIYNLGVIHRDDGPCHYPEHTSEYKRGYADAMNWKAQNHLEHLPAAQPEQEPVEKAMTAHRAAYFMERFKHEEKLLGPNEQAALDFVISMLEAQPEQKPVAMKFKIYKPTVPDPVRQGINNALLPWVYDQDRSSGFDASMWVTPVATLPPQRTWVGLTDEDKKEYVSQDFGGNRLDAMDWAEKRLKERNT